VHQRHSQHCDGPTRNALSAGRPPWANNRPRIEGSKRSGNRAYDERKGSAKDEHDGADAEAVRPHRPRAHHAIGFVAARPSGGARVAQPPLIPAQKPQVAALHLCPGLLAQPPPSTAYPSEHCACRNASRQRLSGSLSAASDRGVVLVFLQTSNTSLESSVSNTSSESWFRPLESVWRLPRQALPESHLSTRLHASLVIAPLLWLLEQRWACQ
jgi:hypothetical protein